MLNIEHVPYILTCRCFKICCACKYVTADANDLLTSALSLKAMISIKSGAFRSAGFFLRIHRKGPKNQVSPE